MEGHEEVLEIERVLQSCLRRLDTIGAQVPAVHLEMCLNELSRFLVVADNPSAEE